MKCKPYSEITVEIGTQLKTVKITSNIFAVHHSLWPQAYFGSRHILARGLFWPEEQIFKSVIFNNFVPSIGFSVINVIFLKASEFSGE